MVILASYCLFQDYTIQRERSQHARIPTSISMNTQNANPILMSTSEGLTIDASIKI
jgi:hypothetical protein